MRAALFRCAESGATRSIGGVDDTAPRQSLPDDLADLIGLLFWRGLGLATLCMVAQPILGIVMSGSGFAAFIAFLFAHGFFIATLTEFGRRALEGEEPVLFETMPIGAAGGIALLVPMLFFALPGWIGPDYPIAALRATPTSIPGLAWVTIGWIAITGLAIPARIVARLNGRRFVGLPAWQTILLMIPCLGLIELFGYPVQAFDGEGWGLFEGGAVMFPLLGAYLFLASFTCALLSALAFRRRRQR